MCPIQTKSFFWDGISAEPHTEPFTTADKSPGAELVYMQPRPLTNLKHLVYLEKRENIPLQNIQQVSAVPMFTDWEMPHSGVRSPNFFELCCCHKIPNYNIFPKQKK